MSTADQAPDVSIVLPTYNRADALRANLGSMLAIADVCELIVVDDGSRDATPEVLAAQTDPRLRVLTQPENRGQPTARNLGVDAATGEWILFGEDDCRFPVDYAAVLKREAAQHRADIVGAPCIHTRADALDAAVAHGRAESVREIGLDMVGMFPAKTVVTPFVPALALIRRSVFETVRFDGGYRGNAWREETAFFVDAMRHGFVCILTPETFSYQTRQWGGGARRSRLSYEYWAARNNWRFLHLHGRWLAEHGYLRQPVLAQLCFVWHRARIVSTGYVRARRRSVGGTT
jgi:glycosyltransferase involved in cell wall biosynthesis